MYQFKTVNDGVLLASALAQHHFYAPFEKGGAYCFAHVGRYVGIP